MKSVVVFTGHMIDKPGRKTPRFPQDSAMTVAKCIAAELDKLGATHGFASAACGGDLLFHEAMLARGGEIHVVLPCSVPEFRTGVVDVIPGSSWGRLFERVMSKAKSVDILSDQCASDNAMASECCGRVALGLGAMTAAEMRHGLTVLAFWDGKPGDALGGTHSLIEFCGRTGRKVVNVFDLPHVPSVPSSTVISPMQMKSSSAVRLTGSENEPSQQICAVVFADVVGFSKITERQFPAFGKHYLHGVKKVLERQRHLPLIRNTWGDGLYLVYPTVSDAGLFALALRDFMKSKKWSKLGLPADFDVRIGVHAGPVYRMLDPITGQYGYFGSQVTQTARIEPITKAGRVYASRYYAALAAADAIGEFRFKYIGTVKLAKGYGKFPLYEMTRA